MLIIAILNIETTINQALLDVWHLTGHDTSSIDSLSFLNSFIFLLVCGNSLELLLVPRAHLPEYEI